MNKEEILKVIDKGLESLLKEPNEIQQAFSNGCRYTMNVFQSANKYWEKVEQENQELKDRIDKALEKIQLLIDIGFDYDGFNKADSLKTLIDELVNFARDSRAILKGDKE